MSNRYFLTICLIVLTCILTKTTQASHSMGADLTYTCLGGNSYKLRLSFYRDCSGIAAPTNVTIDISSLSCGYTLNTTLLPIAGTGQEITPICSSAVSKCNGGTFTGIREYIYEGTVVLPAQCSDWNFSYSLCCRNGAISTIVSPLSENITIHSMLNNVITPCNNSPTFTNKPVPFVCAGQEFCYNHGAYDSDGDSLAYSLINPLGTGGVPVIYIPPYSATQPINSVPAMTFNPLTGDFCATPQTIEVTVMAVLIREYRNGVLIGEVERDMQITVRPCANNLPDLTGINGTNNFTATICADEPFCFDVFSSDTDAVQNLTVSWDQAIPGGSFNSAGAPHPVSTFCWTPSQTDVSNTPHCFTVMVHDDACPYYGSQIYSYCLTVVNLTANAGPDQSVNCGATTVISATGTTTTGSFNYLWSNGITTASQTVGPGNYTVTVTNGLCTASDVVNVNLNSGINIAFSNTTACINNAVTFTNSSFAAVGAISGYSWSFGDGATSTLQNPTHIYNTAGSFTVCLVVYSSLGCMDSVCKNIIIMPPPSADFTVNNDCVGKQLNLTNTSAPGNIISYYWNFGNGITSTLQSPLLSYSNAGTYNVSLIVVDALGCSDTIQYPVMSFAIPVAAFSATGGGLCQGGQIGLTDNSIGSINNWNWDFGNGQYSSLQNPAISYSNPGPYDISLIVTSDKGCTDTATMPVNISMPFVAGSIPAQSVCPGVTATVIASGGNAYLWSNGQTSAAISILPVTTSTYTVTVTDSKGCTDTTQATVTVYPLPQVTVSTGPSLCIGQSATLTAGGATSYSWSTGGTNQSINVTPAVSTSYTVTGTDINGCIDTAMVNVTVHPLPVVSIGNAVICPASTVTLNAGNAGSSYQWNTGATTQNITTAVAGSYIVTVTDNNGCTATGQSNVSSSSLTANVQMPSICAGTSAILSAANAGSTYIWSTGASTQNISVNNPGTYTVTVNDNNGCSISFSSVLTVNPLPLVNYNTGITCLNEPVILSNSSTIASGTINNYMWRFGDGGISQLQNPNHQYLSAGIYNVCLVATSNNGCVDSICQVVTIYTPPTASFSANNNCQGNMINLVNTSTPSGLTAYNWSFGNGATSTTASPAISYNTPGSYQIYLDVMDANGCKDTIQNTVTVYPLPQVTVSTGPSLCIGQSATLTAGGATSYSWSTGGTNQSINVTPTVSTSYTVTGTDINGCIDTAMVSVTVHPLPVVSIGNAVICPASTVTLNAGNAGSSYQWNTGATTQNITTAVAGSYSVTVTDNNGCTATGQSNVSPSSLTANVQMPSICAGTSAILSAANAGSTYIWSTGASTQNISVNNPGTYTVTVNDNNGCSISFSSVVAVNPVPVVNFSVNDVCLTDSAVFVNTSNITSGLLSYYWNFGDGNASSDQYPKHLYLNDGTYSPTLTVTSDSGCTSNKSLQVIVHPKPLSNFTSQPTCQGDAMQFSDKSTINTGSIILHTWNFGDSTALSSVINPAHVYPDAGTYVVTLITSSNFGCVDTVIKSVKVNPNPVAHFIFDRSEGCGPLMVHFTDLSYISSGSLVTWQWNFGDGGTSSQRNPTHVYATAGIYTVTLTVTSGDGCTNIFVISNAITVHPDPVAAFTPGTYETNILQQVSFENQSIDAIGYNWSFGDGSFTHIESPLHIFNNPGTYQVTLTATNQFGCTSEARHEIKIVPVWTVYIPNAFTPNNDSNNDIFTIQGIGIINYNLKIFNRWGDLIFDGNNRGWDGMHAGSTCKQDVYIYKVVFDVNIGGSFERDGQVSLLR